MFSLTSKTVFPSASFGASKKRWMLGTSPCQGYLGLRRWRGGRHGLADARQNEHVRLSGRLRWNLKMDLWKTLFLCNPVNTPSNKHGSGTCLNPSKTTGDSGIGLPFSSKSTTISYVKIYISESISEASYSYSIIQCVYIYIYILHIIYHIYIYI